MSSKIKISPVFKQTFYYSFKVWVVDILIFGVVLSTFYNGISIKFLDIVEGIILTISYSLLSFAIFSFLSYWIIGFTIFNHWVKKIVLLICVLTLILITNCILWGQEDYDGTPYYAIFSFLFSVPTLISIGIFFPDDLDEKLKQTKILRGKNER